VTQEQFERVLNAQLAETCPKLLENDDWKDKMWQAFCRFLELEQRDIEKDIADAKEFIRNFKSLQEVL